MIIRKVFARIRVPLCVTLLVAVGLAGGYLAATALPGTALCQVSSQPGTAGEWAAQYIDLSADGYDNWIEGEDVDVFVTDVYDWGHAIFEVPKPQFVIRWRDFLFVAVYGVPVTPRHEEYADVPLDESGIESWTLIYVLDDTGWHRVEAWKLPLED